MEVLTPLFPAAQKMYPNTLHFQAELELVQLEKSA